MCEDLGRSKDVLDSRKTKQLKLQRRKGTGGGQGESA